MEIRIRDVSKHYFAEGKTIKAVDGVDLAIPANQIFTLLGPSGCGKTTLLRCIVGLETPDTGEIRIGDEVVWSKKKNINVPPEKRGLGMVFQTYAIWPHMNVFDNVAYPLQIRNVSKDVVRERVVKTLRFVRLEGFEKRPATKLSGGQQQRVALARALVAEPKVILFDEPLSNLDAKLRAEMRVEIRALMKRLNITAVYVTHDQEEALVLSDRIAVMHAGEIRQIGSPRDIYVRPENDVVAGFIGTANLLRASISAVPGNAREGLVDTAMGALVCSLPPSAAVGQPVTIMFRPEDVLVSLSGLGQSQNTFSGIVEQAVFVGSRFQCVISVSGLKIECELPKSQVVESGQNVAVEIPRRAIHLLP